ncbi:hypothetical protein F5Y11DRAFT_364345 [Daldinia sp. FL1419]|nr:hypothetical protein F5Y11DRAFT_364345 [Daldinia sp. FL1419]
MTSDIVAQLYYSEYLEDMIARIANFGEEPRYQQLIELPEIVEISRLPVGNQENHLDRVVRHHGIFQGMTRTEQLTYIEHLFTYIYSPPGYALFHSPPFWAVLFQMPMLEYYLETTEPGGAYTWSNIGNWFLWNAQNYQGSRN